VRLHILGSGTAIPHPERGASGYACVAEDGTALLLECGPGSTRRWPAAGLDFRTVRAILVTHHHVDHCADLAAVLFGRNVPEPPIDTPLLLGGPLGHGAHVEGLRRVYGPPVADVVGATRVEELDDGASLSVPPFEVEARHVRHASGALGLRVTSGGRALAFSGDSGPCAALVALCRGADVALLECSYPSARASDSHLNATTAARPAVEAGVARLVLTHFYPECDAVDVAAEVRAAGYAGALHLARDGDVVEV